MILDVSRSHIKVELEEKTISVPGEMFFPPDDKLGVFINLCHFIKINALALRSKHDTII